MEIEEITPEEETIEEIEAVVEPEAAPDVEAGADPVPEPAPEDAYAPDFSYKVHDEVREIPEMYRTLVTDKETEDQVRQLFCKADGLDVVKPKHEKTKAERDEWMGKYETINKEHAGLQEKFQHFGHYAQNDLGALFEYAGIPPEKVFDWAEREIDLRQMPAEQRRPIEETQRMARDVYMQQQEVARQKQGNDAVLKQQHDMAMNSAMMVPENSAFQKEFDSRLGEGSFLQHVNNYGDEVYYNQKRYVSPFEAVQAVVGRYKPAFQTTTPAPGNPAAAAAPQTPPPMNIASGSHASPTSKQVNSLAELYQRAESANSAAGQE